MTLMRAFVMESKVIRDHLVPTPAGRHENSIEEKTIIVDFLHMAGDISIKEQESRFRFIYRIVLACLASSFFS